MTHHTAESRRRTTDVLTGGHRLTSVVLDPDAAGSPSVDEVLRDLVDHGCRRLADRVTAAGIIRRRSVTEVLIEGMDVLWDDVLAHPDEYRAVLMLQRTRPELRVPGPDGDVALYELPPAWAAHWLTVLQTLQDVSWNTPVPLLARLLSATLSGLVTHAVCEGGDVDVRPVFRVLAYDLAQHSTRNRHPRVPRG